MNDDVVHVFNGFLRLRNLDKLAMVEAINEYFDSIDRETIRRNADLRYQDLLDSPNQPVCTCCDRGFRAN